MDRKLFMKKGLIVLAMPFFLTACFESETTSTTTISSSSTGSSDDGTVEISGTISYQRAPFSSTSGAGLDYDNIETLPVRGATLIAVDINGNTLDTTTTSDTGAYSVTVDQNEIVRIIAYAQTISTGTAKWNFEIRDNTSSNGLYGMQSSISNADTSADATRNLLAPIVWDGSAYTNRLGASFAILDNAYDVVQKIVAVDSDVELPAADIFWSENNNTASPSLESNESYNADIASGNIGTSFYSNNTLYILGKEGVDTDEFDEHIIIHELGHFIEDNLSRADSIGGSHSSGNLLDMRVALGEGFGNAFSGMVTDDPLYRDSLGSIQSSEFQVDVDQNINTNPGWFSEASVQAILYDLYDGDVDADGSDNIELGFAGIYGVLTSSSYINQPSMTSIFSFIDELKTQNPSLTTNIDAVVAAQNIDGNTAVGIDTVEDKYGTNETHAGHLDQNLPIYKTLSDDGLAVKVCSHILAQQYNGLGVRQFLRFTPSSAGDFTISANFLATGTGDDYILEGESDPDFNLYLNGDTAEGIDGSTTGTGGSSEIDEEVIQVSLQNDEYILEVYDWANVENDSTRGGTACYNVTVTNS